EGFRHNRHGRWIPRLLEFAKHGGDTLLALGDDLGTDAVLYARHGADVLACSPVAERLALVRRNFELRGLKGRFLHAGPAALPLPASVIDVACLHGLPGGQPLEPVVEELYRVLKPGGKVLALLPARYDIDFWRRAWRPWKKAVREPSFTAAS